MKVQWIKKLIKAAFAYAFLLSSQLSFAAEVRIAVPESPLSLPFFVAHEMGYFEKNGIRPKLMLCKSGRQCTELMKERRVDLAASSELPLMYLAFEGSPVSILSTFAINKNHLKLLALREKVTDPNWRWQGKRIGYAPKTASHYFMDVFLIYNGIEPGELVEISKPVEDLPAALLRGEVDAISVWEPYANKTLSDQKQEVVSVDLPHLYTQSFNLTVHNDFKKKQPKQVKAMLHALGEAIDHIGAFPLRSKVIMSRNLKMSKEYVDQIWHRYMFRLELQRSLISTLNGQAQWAIRENHLQQNPQKAPNFKEMIDASFLREYKPEQVDFIYR